MTPLAAIREGLSLLPEPMRSDRALVMLVAIGLQESRFTARRQLVGSPPRPIGPAKSYWQGELGGGMVAGVRTHKATRDHAAKVYEMRGVPANNRAIWNTIEFDDVLAAALARLLLYSDPKPLPAIGDVNGAWDLYIRTWRPGAYSRGSDSQKKALRAKWTTNYACALREVTG